MFWNSFTQTIVSGKSVARNKKWQIQWCLVLSFKFHVHYSFVFFSFALSLSFHLLFNRISSVENQQFVYSWAGWEREFSSTFVIRHVFCLHNEEMKRFVFFFLLSLLAYILFTFQMVLFFFLSFSFIHRWHGHSNNFFFLLTIKPKMSFKKWFYFVHKTIQMLDERKTKAKPSSPMSNCARDEKNSNTPQNHWTEMGITLAHKIKSNFFANHSLSRIDFLSKRKLF